MIPARTLLLGLVLAMTLIACLIAANAHAARPRVGKFQAVWTAQGGVSHFQVEIKTKWATNTYSVIDAPNLATYIYSFSSRTPAQIRVRAIADDGTVSAWSNAVLL